MSNVPTIAGKPIRLGDHGSRARYVHGCRCTACRRANFLRVQARDRRAAELARALPPAPPVPGKTRTYTYPDGRVVTRVFRNGCPGVQGKPCRWKAHVRKDSPGGRCGKCRNLLAWNGLVSTVRTVAHIAKLSRAGIGIAQVADAAGVSRTTLLDIKCGRQTQLRKSTQDSVLAVDEGARADRSLVPAARTHALIRHLVEEGGFTKTRLARELGYKGVNPSLHFNGPLIAARNAHKVERLYHRYMDDVA